MTLTETALAAIGLVAVGIAGIIYGWNWQDRRKRRPMLPLPLRNPVHDRPAVPLSGCEKFVFGLLAESFDHVSADDPMEKR